MAVYFVPAAPTTPTPADGDDYTYNPPRAGAYDLRPAPMRQEARIASLEARIAELENEQQIAAAEHGDAIATLEAEIKGLAATTAGALAMVEAWIAAIEAGQNSKSEAAGSGNSGGTIGGTGSPIL